MDHDTDILTSHMHLFETYAFISAKIHILGLFFYLSNFICET